MKKWFFSGLLLAFTAVFGWTQTATDSLAADHPENSLLWEISGKDLSTPSYLYGTIHMIDKDDFFLTTSAKEAFKTAQRITFEINLEEMNSLGAQFSLLMKAFMDGGVTLKSLLSPEDYKLVDAHFQEMGLPLFLFERVKPMFLTVLAGDMSPEDYQAGEVVSYEMEFAKMAEGQDKEMAGLETIEFQMSMFDSIPYSVQAEMLVETIKADDSGDDQVDQMVEMYKRQDLQGLAKMISSEDSGFAEYEELLLVNRNKNWIPLMGAMMLEKPTFFAVGAGHLPGEYGVIELLRREGYTLRPLKS